VWQWPNGGGKVAELVGEAMDQKKYKNPSKIAWRALCTKTTYRANTSTPIYAVLDLDPQVLTTIGDLYTFFKSLRFVQRLGK
jgi:hypothetical protein